MALTGVLLAMTGISGQSWEMVFTWLCLMGFFTFFWPSPFWVLPTLTLSPAVAAVAIGFINMCANIAGLVGNGIVGEMQKAGQSDRNCLLFLSGCYVAGGLIIALLRVPTSKPRNSSE
jgi:ACS family tartrate transporter-like MFS transporter